MCSCLSFDRADWCPLPLSLLFVLLLWSQDRVLSSICEACSSTCWEMPWALSLSSSAHWSSSLPMGTGSTRWTLPWGTLWMLFWCCSCQRWQPKMPLGTGSQYTSHGMPHIVHITWYTPHTLWTGDPHVEQRWQNWSRNGVHLGADLTWISKSIWKCKCHCCCFFSACCWSSSF